MNWFLFLIKKRMNEKLIQKVRCNIVVNARNALVTTTKNWSFFYRKMCKMKMIFSIQQTPFGVQNTVYVLSFYDLRHNLNLKTGNINLSFHPWKEFRFRSVLSVCHKQHLWLLCVLYPNYTPVTSMPRAIFNDKL